MPAGDGVTGIHKVTTPAEFDAMLACLAGLKKPGVRHHDVAVDLEWRDCAGTRDVHLLQLADRDRLFVVDLHALAAGSPSKNQAGAPAWLLAAGCWSSALVSIR